MKLHKIGALAAVSVLAFAACSNSGSSAAPSGAAASGGAARDASGDANKGTVKIAIELPLQGSELAASQPIINGIQLAVKEPAARPAATRSTIPKLSHLRRRHERRARSADRRQRTWATSSPTTNVVAVIGPLNSSVAKVQIPISNEAGLLQCSPGQHEPGPDQAAIRRTLDIRKTNPHEINYIRVVTTDDDPGSGRGAVHLRRRSARRTSTSSTTPRPSGRASPTRSRPSTRGRGGTVVKLATAPRRPPPTTSRS